LEFIGWMGRMTFTEIGALIGTITGTFALAFSLLDRFAFGRPVTSIRRSEKHGRDLCCINASNYDLLITKMWARPRWVSVIYGTSLDAHIDAAMEEQFPISIAPGEERRLPIIIRKGELLDEDRTDLVPFIIIVNWRKTRSVWLPQIPVFIFSSARSLRRLQDAK
jgi:hypothetical protein